jgi:hypothetical protein
MSDYRLDAAKELLDGCSDGEKPVIGAAVCSWLESRVGPSPERDAMIARACEYAELDAADTATATETI